jgi:hypothetical protein
MLFFRSWYRSAQSVRVREEQGAEMYEVIDEDSDIEIIYKESSPADGSSNSPPTTPKCEQESSHSRNRSAKHQQETLTELYIHEVTALISCFLCPMLGAYLLHAIRAQLSRPSEGLVSNYNLTIFLLAAEIKPLSHLMTLVQSRTLHLQRIVNKNPYRHETVRPAQFEDLAQRLASLESVKEAADIAQSGSGHMLNKDDGAAVKEVRDAIQPDLDALNRAVRRYEKKANLLAMQVESRLATLDSRVGDAISLAAAAEKNSSSKGGVVSWIFDFTTTAIMLPYYGVMSLISLPYKTALALVGGDSDAQSSNRHHNRSHRNGKAPLRVPGRILNR